MRSTPPARGCVKSRTEATHALAHSPRGITAGSAATSSMRSTSPTTRRRSGPSGTGTSPSEAFHRCSSSRVTSGATAWARSTSPISARQTGSHACGCSHRDLGAEAGPPTRGWARSSGRRGGRAFWRRAQRGPTAGSLPDRGRDRTAGSAGRAATRCRRAAGAAGRDAHVRVRRIGPLAANPGSAGCHTGRHGDGVELPHPGWGAHRSISSSRARSPSQSLL
jgi:hypothetical protein